MFKNESMLHRRLSYDMYAANFLVFLNSMYCICLTLKIMFTQDDTDMLKYWIYTQTSELSDQHNTTLI